MRTLLILVFTINVMMMGCQTAKKSTHCGASCGGCAAAPPCTVSVGPVQPQQIAQAAEPVQPHPEITKVHAERPQRTALPTVNAFKETKPAPLPEPAVLAVPEYGHGKKYEWLVGRLQRVHSPGHQWKIRYAPLDEHEEWGGSMILAADARLDDWHDGDLVYVEGEILNERPSVYLAGPLYRVRIIRHAHEVTHIIPRGSK